MQHSKSEERKYPYTFHPEQIVSALNNKHSAFFHYIGSPDPDIYQKSIDEMKAQGWLFFDDFDDAKAEAKQLLDGQFEAIRKAMDNYPAENACPL